MTTLTTNYDPVVNLARQSLYRFASLAFTDPRKVHEDDFRSLCASTMLVEAAALLRGLPEAAPAELAPGEHPLTDLDPRKVLARLPYCHEALNAEYENTFGLVIASTCPPYETEYIDSKFEFQRSSTLADINGFYRAFGLTVAKDYSERSDHIALELEFMACLLRLERQTVEDSSFLRNQRAAVCHEAQCRFVKEHLAWWVPAFVRLLNIHNSGSFYAAVGNFLAALIPAERGLLGLPPITRSAAPYVADRPEFCEGCAFAS